MYPLRFQPFYRPAPWGGQALARFLGKNLPTAYPHGESWEVSDHATHRSVLATGSLAGRTLRELMTTHRGALLGPAAGRHETFPWLIKFLDVRDWLSVQVHPDADAVERLWPGECAKTEAWLVVDAQLASRIHAGLRPGVGAKELRAAIEAGTAADCLHSFVPQRGDVVFLPAGTVHAAGGGLLLAEIQQTSDATFRLYDWDRRDAEGKPRTLHIEQGLAAIDWNQGPREPIRTSLTEGPGGDARARLIDCPHFQVDYVAKSAPFDLGGTGTLQALIVTDGHGRLDNGEYVLAGDAWVLPAEMPSLRLTPEARITGLLCSLP